MNDTTSLLLRTRIHTLSAQHEDVLNQITQLEQKVEALHKKAATLSLEINDLSTDLCEAGTQWHRTIYR